MEQEFWNQKWQSNEIGFNQSQPNPLLQRYFPEFHLKPGDRVLVPLCGKSIDMLWLAGQGFKVIGVELNPLACKAFFQENRIPVKITETDDFVVYSSDEITLFSGDFFKFDKSMSGRIDAIYDRAALIALPEDMRRSYANNLSQLAAPGRGVLLITMPYDQTEMQGPPFSVDESEVNRLFTPHFDISQLYNSPVKDVPAFLQARGLLQATDQAWYLTPKNDA